MTQPSVTDYYYRDLLADALHSGLPVTTRNSRVRRLVGRTYHFRRTPLVCLRKTSWKTALREWEFFMSGSAHFEDMHESVKLWWRPWVSATGRLVNHYGKQFRQFWGFGGSVDQIDYLVRGVRDHPYGRRNVVTTWHAYDMAHPETPLTTCHGTVIQAFVGDHHDANALSLVTYQRSADIMVGLPANFMQYWAFLLWLAHRTGRSVGTLTYILGDAHLYECHFELAERVIAAPPEEDAPELVYTPTSTDFLASDFSLDRPYNPKITDRAEMVV